MNPIDTRTSCSPIGEPFFPSRVWEKACVTIGRYWYLFKRLTAVGRAFDLTDSNT